MPPRVATTTAFILAMGLFASYLFIVLVPLTPDVVLFLEATMLVSLLACPFALATGLWLVIGRRTLLGLLLLAL